MDKEIEKCRIRIIKDKVEVICPDEIVGKVAEHMRKHGVLVRPYLHGEEK